MLVMVSRVELVARLVKQYQSLSDKIKKVETESTFVSRGIEAYEKTVKNKFGLTY